MYVKNVVCQLNESVEVEFQRTHALSMHFQSAALAVIMHYSCWHSALHTLSSLNSLIETELHS